MNCFLYSILSINRRDYLLLRTGLIMCMHLLSLLADGDSEGHGGRHELIVMR